MQFAVALLISPILVVLLALLILAVVAVGFLYARQKAGTLLRERQELDKAVAGIDLLLKQRHDELPKLLSTARSYMAAGSKALQAIGEARSAYSRSSNPAERARASRAEAEAVRGLFQEAEQYADLKLNNSFRQIRKRLGDLDLQISKELNRVAGDVRAFNRRRSAFPVSLIASLNKIQPRAEIESGELQPKA